MTLLLLLLQSRDLHINLDKDAEGVVAAVEDDDDDDDDDDEVDKDGDVDDEDKEAATGGEEKHCVNDIDDDEEADDDEEEDNNDDDDNKNSKAGGGLCAVPDQILYVCNTIGYTTATAAAATEREGKDIEVLLAFIRFPWDNTLFIAPDIHNTESDMTSSRMVVTLSSLYQVTYQYVIVI